MTKSVGVHEAKTHLSRLLAEVTEGAEVIISNRGEPVARLVPIRRETTRVLGSDRGRFEVPDDFDAPLPDGILATFEA
jgi:prevent-host-death family protein